MDKVLAMVLAGGRVDELLCLTEKRPKSAVPIFGSYRIIDFVLSNMMHSGINNVGILSQYRPYALVRHIGTGEHWDFLGRRRGIRILPPYRGFKESDWYKGTADAIYQNISYIEEFNPEHILIASADHIYRMDYKDLFRYHLENDADVTVSFTKLKDTQERFGYGVIDSKGGLVKYLEKPKEPPSCWVSMTVYLFKKDVLIKTLKANVREPCHEFGHDIIPNLVSKCRLFGFKFKGYWAYARTIASYYNTNMDLLRKRISLKQWQVRTNNIERCIFADRLPAKIIGRVSNSVISDGCIVEGKVVNSILSPGVKILKGTEVYDSIIFHDTVVRENSCLKKVICDKDSIIEKDCVIGGFGEDTPSAEYGKLFNSGLTILGRNSYIPPHTIIGANTVVYSSAKITQSSLKPGTTIR